MTLTSVNAMVAVCVEVLIIRKLATAMSIAMTAAQQAMLRASAATVATLIYIRAGAREAVAACPPMAPVPADGYSSM